MTRTATAAGAARRLPLGEGAPQAHTVRITPDGSQPMHLPLDMRATMLATSLDVIAEEIDAVRRGRPVSPTLEAVLADAQDSAHILADELYPAQAVAVGETRRSAGSPAAPAPTRAFSGNVVQLRPRRS